MAQTLLQDFVQPEGKPMLSKFSSKVEGLLDELTDVLGAFEHIAPTEGENLTTTSCRQTRFITGLS